MGADLTMSIHKHTYSRAVYALGRRGCRYDYLSLVFRNGVRHWFALPKPDAPPREPEPRLHRLIGRRQVEVARMELELTCPPLDLVSLGRPLGDMPVTTVTAEWEEPS